MLILIKFVPERCIQNGEYCYQVDWRKIKRKYVHGKEVCNKEWSDWCQGKVFIVWGKSKSAYNAEVDDDGSNFRVPQKATRAAAEEDELFTLELVYSPATAQTGRSCAPGEREPALIKKMDSLADVVAGLETRVACHFQ